MYHKRHIKHATLFHQVLTAELGLDDELLASLTNMAAYLKDGSKKFMLGDQLTWVDFCVHGRGFRLPACTGSPCVFLSARMAVVLGCPRCFAVAANVSTRLSSTTSLLSNSGSHTPPQLAGLLTLVSM